MSDGILLLLASAPSLGSCQLSDLVHDLAMSPIQCFNRPREGDEGDAFPLTSPQVVPALLVEGYGEGVSRCGDRMVQPVSQQGTYHSDM